MNKKLYFIILLISSLFFSILFQNRSKEDIEALNVENVLTNISHKQRYEFSVFNANREKIDVFHKQLLDLAIRDKMTIKTGYDQYLDNGDKVIRNYIYDPDNLYFTFLKDQFEYQGQNIDYGNMISQGYVTTRKDSNASGMIELFNKNYLKTNHIIYEQRCMGEFVKDYKSVNNNVNYYVFINNNDDKREIEELIKIHFDDSQYDISEQLSEHNELISHNSYVVLVFFSISFLICLLYDLFKKYREIAIVNLMGYKQINIFYNYFLKESCLSFIVLLSSMLLYYIVFVSRVNSHTISFIKDIILFIFISIGLFVILVIIFMLYLYKTKSYINIVRKKSFHSLVLIQLISKVIFMIIFTFFIIYSVLPTYPYYQMLYSYYKQKDIINNVYDIKNIQNSKDYSKILCQNGAIACDFTDILRNSQNNNQYIPYIIVNQEFLSLYNIHKNVQGPTLLIPQEYKNIDVKQYQYTLNTKVEYIKEKYEFYDPSLSILTSIKNPIILIMNEDYPYMYHSLYLKKEKSIDYYKTLLADKIDRDQINIQDNGIYIQWILRENALPVVFDNVLFLGLYLFTYFLILELLVNIYIKNNDKEISLKMIYGYKYIHLYKELYLLDMMTFMIPIIIAVKIGVLQDLLYYLSMMIVIDGFYIFYKTYRLIYKIELLKEV